MMVITLIAVVLWLVVLLAAVPVLVVWLQVCLAWPSRHQVLPALPHAVPDDGLSEAPSFAVLVPAHNEEAVIADTVRQLMKQLRPTDTLLVVADNCTDATARLAGEAGATVVERSDALRRGKGYALDHGMRWLAARPHAVLIIVDADCRVEPGGLGQLAAKAHAVDRPVQALYLMHAPPSPTLKQRVAAFAWRLKNWVRPLGWHNAGWPCQLMGTGMAFPWAMAQNMALANAELVEDMKLGVDLALAGTPPLFCPQVLVHSHFPTSEQATQGQRKRWEHGHLGVIASQAPRLLAQAWRRRDARLWAMALDLSVPPLALLVLLQLAALGLAGMGAWLGLGSGPLEAAIGCLAMFAMAVGAAWWGWGRSVVSARDLLTVPWYVLGKLPLYLGYVFKRQKEWVRTDRK
ncbi:glycosyltransferase family 2 protein [Hydrogenophaga atypica]|uniref:Glycosyltransferase family 2 protein n=1 Tax=Hydrogenophaga atypica TaxID=249409 RepID=A0ABW2QG63_9BURK